MELYDRENRICCNLQVKLKDNIELLERLFQGCDDVVKKEFTAFYSGIEIDAYMVYVDGLADNVMVQEHVLEPLMTGETTRWTDSCWEALPGELQETDRNGEALPGEVQQADENEEALPGEVKNADKSGEALAGEVQGGDEFEEALSGELQGTNGSGEALPGSHQKMDGNEGTLQESAEEEWIRKGREFYHVIMQCGIEMVDLKEEPSFDSMMNHILNGDTALLIDGVETAIVISSKKLPLRGIEEAETEAVMRGPRDSFNESIRINTALIRRRIKDARCKIVQNKYGERTQTDYALVYMEDLVQKDLLNRIEDQMSVYSPDAIYDSGMLEHYLHHKWYSPFPIVQSTERPDKVASAVLEGRVAIVVDNSPEVLLFPATFNTFLQASDDYYNQWTVATFARILRYIASILAIGLPGFYIAITNYHIEMLPTKLLLAIAQARGLVTFPVVVEMLLMELLFELLREAGIRLPGPLGNTIGIVGGLIVGQAAVEAELVSTIVVIVVALTALASFTIPNEGFASAYRLLKFFLILVSAIWGLYGFTLGMLVIAIHLSGLISFGVPYMVPAVSSLDGRFEGKRDFILRLPLYTMKRRPVFTKESERNRLRKRNHTGR